MTPEEMTAALGVGWERLNDWAISPVWVESRGAVEVCLFDGVWRVSLLDEDRDEATLLCVSGEAAVAVAGLLVAAEWIAAGTEVAIPEPGDLRYAAGRVNQRPAVLRQTVRGHEFLWPHEARRYALDLLRAADEAEAQP